MKDTFTAQFFLWADANNIGREHIAKATGNSKQTVSNWKSVGIPKAKRLECQDMMNSSKQPELEEMRNRIVFELERGQFTRWNQAALDAGKTIEDWAFEGLEQMAIDHFYEKAA